VYTDINAIVPHLREIILNRRNWRAIYELRAYDINISYIVVYYDIGRMDWQGYFLSI
jgi:hypothetical protein